jgi:hypothetical protein
LRNIFDTEEINYGLVQDLNEEEQELFKKLISKAGLESQLDFDERKVEPSPKQLVEKFNILKCEIIAGNDNALILSDIEKVIRKLRERDVIDDEKLDEIMNVIKNI